MPLQFESFLQQYQALPSYLFSLLHLGIDCLYGEYPSICQRVIVGTLTNYQSHLIDLFNLFRFFFFFRWYHKIKRVIIFFDVEQLNNVLMHLFYERQESFFQKMRHKGNHNISFPWQTDFVISECFLFIQRRIMYFYEHDDRHITNVLFRIKRDI